MLIKAKASGLHLYMHNQTQSKRTIIHFLSGYYLFASLYSSTSSKCCVVPSTGMLLISAAHKGLNSERFPFPSPLPFFLSSDTKVKGAKPTHARTVSPLSSREGRGGHPISYRSGSLGYQGPEETLWFRQFDALARAARGTQMLSGPHCFRQRTFSFLALAKKRAERWVLLTAHKLFRLSLWRGQRRR